MTKSQPSTKPAPGTTAAAVKMVNTPRGRNPGTRGGAHAAGRGTRGRGGRSPKAPIVSTPEKKEGLMA